MYFSLSMNERIKTGRGVFSFSGVVRSRVDHEARHLLNHVPGERIEETHLIHFVIKELNPDRCFRVFRGEDIDRVAPDAERAAAELHIASLVLHANQLPHEVLTGLCVTAPDDETHLRVALRLPDAVDRGHRRHDDHVTPLKDRFRRG